MASRILIGFPVISFAAMTSGPVIQNGCFEVRKFQASVGSESARNPNFARIATTSSLGSTSANQRSCFQNAAKAQVFLQTLVMQIQFGLKTELQEPPPMRLVCCTH